MKLKTLSKLIVDAYNKEAEKKVWQRWLADYNLMATMSFADYKKKSFSQEHKTGKTKEEILEEAEKIKALDQRKGGN